MAGPLLGEPPTPQAGPHPLSCLPQTLPDVHCRLLAAGSTVLAQKGEL